MNERIREVNATLSAPAESYELICECDDPDCFQRIVVPASVYEEVRADGRQFFVAVEHDGTVDPPDGGAYRLYEPGPTLA